MSLNISIFKKSACQKPHPFNKPRCVYEIYNWKIKASLLSNYVTYWNAQMNPASKSKQLFGWNRQPDKRIRLTVSFMLNIKVCKFNKDGLQLAMINFFLPLSTQITKISIIKFFMYKN